MSYKKERKPNFRNAETKKVSRKQGKRHPIHTMPLAVWLFFTLPSLAMEAQTENQIKQYVSSQFEQEVHDYARNEHWQHYRLNYELWLPKSVQHLPKCTKRLFISTRDYHSLPIGNLKRAISCNDLNNTWRINVTIKASISLPVVVTDKTINRNTTLSAADLKVERRTLTKQDSFYTDPNQAIGLETIRRIRGGSVLSQSDVQVSAVIEKGNEIILIANKDGFIATTKGIALEDGYLGKQIEVQNISSGNVIRAVVTGKNQAKTLF